MKYKAKVTASVEMIVWINESTNGDKEIWVYSEGEIYEDK